MRRLLPLLLLAALLTSSCGDGARGSDADRGTVRGAVLLGPMCPVQTESSPCPDEPLAGVTVQALLQGGSVVATARSDAQGRFTFDLAPGIYVLQAAPDYDRALTSKPTEVAVTAGQTVEVDISVDSGIR